MSLLQLRELRHRESCLSHLSKHQLGCSTEFKPRKLFSGGCCINHDAREMQARIVPIQSFMGNIKEILDGGKICAKDHMVLVNHRMYPFGTLGRWNICVWTDGFSQHHSKQITQFGHCLIQRKCYPCLMNTFGSRFYICLPFSIIIIFVYYFCLNTYYSNVIAVVFYSITYPPL